MRQPSIENQRLKVAKLESQVAKLRVKEKQLEEAKTVLENLTSEESVASRIERLERLRAEEAKLAAEVEEIQNTRDSEDTETDGPAVAEDTDEDD